MGEWGTCGLSLGRAEGCKGGRAERGLQGAVSLLRPPTRRRATSLTWEVSSLFGPKHPSAQESNGGHAGGCPLGRCLSGTVGSEKDAFLGVSGWPQNQSQQLGSHCAHTHTQTQTHMHTHRHTQCIACTFSIILNDIFDINLEWYRMSYMHFMFSYLLRFSLSFSSLNLLVADIF